MGIAADLGYSFRKPNPFQRSMQALAGTRPGAWFFSKVLRHLDSGMARLTGGRTTIAETLAGLPVLDVTTTGRRSGQRRTSHLIAIPHGDTLALLGTNFGQTSTPAWVLNLEAEPQAHAQFKARGVDVVARAATEDELAAIFAASRDYYGGYAKYQQRITGRRVRAFVLEPAPPVRPSEA
jgi:deazaflavin-dependent oxidoreductase (nitroreductase family)